MKLLQHEPSPVCGKSSVKKGLRAYAAATPFVLPGLLLVLAANLIYIALAPQKEKATV